MSEYINYRLDGELMGRLEKRTYIANIGDPVGYWDPRAKEFAPASPSIDVTTYDSLSKIPDGLVLVAVVNNQGAFEAALPMLEERDMQDVWGAIVHRKETRPVHLYLLNVRDVEKMMGKFPANSPVSTLNDLDDSEEP